ncbi:Lysophospholipase [Pseudomonas amygdali pv. ciccaronei]|nr:Lysophospholipase [Pseudomonas amygdali pv. ciccaronei]
MIKSRLASLLSLLTLQACTSMAESEAPTQRFEDYRQQTIELIRKQRNFQTADHEAELGWNAPRQWTPTGTPKGGVLLVHGLGDSAWSFNDVAQKLADQGYLWSGLCCCRGMAPGPKTCSKCVWSSGSRWCESRPNS